MSLWFSFYRGEHWGMQQNSYTKFPRNKWQNGKQGIHLAPESMIPTIMYLYTKWLKVHWESRYQRILAERNTRDNLLSYFTDCIGEAQEVVSHTHSLWAGRSTRTRAVNVWNSLPSSSFLIPHCLLWTSWAEQNSHMEDLKIITQHYIIYHT